MVTSQPGEEWLSLREAADMLGIHPATVRQWADRNELPSRRTSGGHRRFRRSDIEARLRQESERSRARALCVYRWHRRDAALVPALR
jgi:excisionase family DNA binding protein